MIVAALQWAIIAAIAAFLLAEARVDLVGGWMDWPVYDPLDG